MFLVSKKQKLLMTLCCLVYGQIQSGLGKKPLSKTIPLSKKSKEIIDRAIGKAIVIKASEGITDWQPIIAAQNSAAFLSAIPRSTKAAPQQIDQFNAGFELMVQKMPAKELIQFIPQTALQSERATQQAITRLFSDTYTVQAYLFNQNFVTSLLNSLKALQANKIMIVNNDNSIQLFENLTTAVVPFQDVTSLVPSLSQMRDFIRHVTLRQQMNMPESLLPEQELYLYGNAVSFDEIREDSPTYQDLADVYKNAGIISDTSRLQNLHVINDFFKNQGAQLQSYAEKILMDYMSRPEINLVDILNGTVQGMQSVQDFVQGLHVGPNAAKAYELFTKKYVAGALQTLAAELVEFNTWNQRAYEQARSDESKMSFDIPTDFINYLKFLLGVSAGVAAVYTADETRLSNIAVAQEDAARDALQAAFELEFAKQQQAANLAAIQAAIDQQALSAAEAKKAQEEHMSLSDFQHEQHEKSLSFDLPPLIQFDEKSCKEFINDLRTSISDLIPLQQLLARIDIWIGLAKQTAQQVDYKQIVQNIRAYADARSQYIFQKISDQLQNLPKLQDLKSVDYAKFIQTLAQHLTDRSLFEGHIEVSLKELPEFSMENLATITNEVQTYFRGVSQDFMKQAAEIAMNAQLYAIDFTKSASKIIQKLHDQMQRQHPNLARSLKPHVMLQPGTQDSVDQLYLIAYCKQQAAAQHATGLIVPPAKGQGMLTKAHKYKDFAQIATVVSKMVEQYGQPTKTVSVSDQWLKWQRSTMQTQQRIPAIVAQYKQLLIQEREKQGTLTNSETKRITRTAGSIYQNLPALKQYIELATDAVRMTQGLTPEMVVNNTINLADGTTLPALSTVVPVTDLQDIKTFVQTGIEFLIAQDRGETKVLELMPRAAQPAIAYILPALELPAVTREVSQAFKSDTQQFSIQLAQALFNSGIMTVTSQNIQAAIQTEGIRISGLSDPNNMAYLMGYVQMKIWMLEGSGVPKGAGRRGVSTANVWSVVEVVKFVR
ncbi:MAG TPA: hypothetical protein VLG50_03095 [Candidatus Saccharimonadales bacterium]|nr:hypothetical protein [Candidatus Saccharimonadales bacterium]